MYFKSVSSAILLSFISSFSACDEQIEPDAVRSVDYSTASASAISPRICDAYLEIQGEKNIARMEESYQKTKNTSRILIRNAVGEAARSSSNQSNDDLMMRLAQLCLGLDPKLQEDLRRNTLSFVDRCAGHKEEVKSDFEDTCEGIRKRTQTDLSNAEILQTLLTSQNTKEIAKRAGLDQLYK